MGKLGRLRKLRINRAELVFLVLAGVMYKLPSYLSVHMLAYACLAGSWAVKLIGLPAQINKIRRERSAAGLSLLRNVLDYESYVLWWLYGQSIHNHVIAYGQAPGAIMVGIITLLHLRHGSFPWQRLRNSFGHFDGDRNCPACRAIGQYVCSADLRAAWWVATEDGGLPPRGLPVNLETCRQPECGGVLHISRAVNQPSVHELYQVAKVSRLAVWFRCDRCESPELETIELDVPQPRVARAA